MDTLYDSIDGHLPGNLGVHDVATFLAANAMVFGGVVPYVPQYWEIKKSGNADGFSTFVCLTLLIANMLRIEFWFGRPFELPLLLQSIVMIITMLGMVRLCTLVRSRTELIASKPRLFTDLDSQYFWRWTHFPSYVQFLTVFMLFSGIITYTFLDAWLYVEVLGFISLFVEAMLGAPQFYRNFVNKSTKGMSIVMVLMWTCGDIFKTVYFLVRHAPPQFWVCGGLQVGLDLSILMQVFYYRGDNKPATQ